MKRAVRRLLAVLGALVLAALAVFAWVEIKMAPLALAMAQAKAERIAVDILNRAAAQTVEQLAYDDLVAITYDQQGHIAALRANTAALNALASDAALAAQEKIGALGEQTIAVPLGTAMGFHLFSGRGPDLYAQVTPFGAVSSEICSQFTSAGINQTIHSLTIRLTANMTVVLAGASSRVQVSCVVPVAQTVLVGEVPQTFLGLDGMPARLELTP